MINLKLKLLGPNNHYAVTFIEIINSNPFNYSKAEDLLFRKFPSSSAKKMTRGVMEKLPNGERLSANQCVVEGDVLK